ncbi:hypothetical protein NA8A_09714 [Nitratireductor indicus C115]|uniref:Uncharacterized protein n=1 Tax=Nitratireductor indicus C115 TaxID=1231190 RepID=K2NUA9_9HYPH|nr:hypothetical protein NA8A_09714 [Nitratireductor indicus C115]
MQMPVMAQSVFMAVLIAAAAKAVKTKGGDEGPPERLGMRGGRKAPTPINRCLQATFVKEILRLLLQF